MWGNQGIHEQVEKYWILDAHCYFHWHAIIQYWLRLSLQLENHDPVNVTWCLNEFTSTISKLCLIIKNSLDKDDDRQVKTCFKAFCLKVENDIKVLSLQNMTIN